MALTGRGGLEQDEPATKIEKLEKSLKEMDERLKNIEADVQKLMYNYWHNLPMR